MIKAVIVDDAKSVKELLSLMDWAEMNYEITATANSGSEAVELVSLFNPDLIITNTTLSDMSGMDMIRQVKRIKGNTKFLIISESTDFNDLRFAVKHSVIDFIPKPADKDELIHTLTGFAERFSLKQQRHANQQQLRQKNKNDIERMRRCFFDDVLFPKIYSGTTDIAELSREYYLNFEADEFCSFIIKLDGEIYGFDDRMIIEAINDRAGKYCCEMNFLRQKDRLVFIANYAAPCYESIKEALKYCVERFNKDDFLPQDVVATVCIGGSGNSISGLRSSYMYALEAVNQRVIDGCKRLIYYVPTQDKFDYNSIVKEFGKKIAEAVELLDMELINSQIDIIKTYLDTHCLTGTSYYHSVNLTAMLLLMYTNSAHDINDDITELYNIYNLRINMCSSTAQMIALLKDIVNTLFAGIISKSKSSDILPIRIAKKYILDNYMHPISLEEISKEVGFNSSYFSSMFKRECGVGFLEYLSNVRINRAMSLLKDTNMRVADVCASVGYTDLKHFTKTFRAKTGFSPTEFRKSHT